MRKSSRLILLILIILVSLSTSLVTSCDSSMYPITGYKNNQIGQDNVCSFVYDLLTSEDTSGK